MTSLLLCNLYFISDFEVNFISERQLLKKRSLLKIVLAKIKVRQNWIIVKLVGDYLYILDIPDF